MDERQQRLLCMVPVSEGEDTSEEAENELDEETLKNDKNQEEGIVVRKKQFFLFKSERSKYPRSWKGPVQNGSELHDVYGLVIGVYNGNLYIRSYNNLHTYRPKFLNEKKQALLGCWVKLVLGPNRECIVGEPKYAKAPLHTRVFNRPDGLPFILVYDFVKINAEHALESKFLGEIWNTLDLTHRGPEWSHCNVEYKILPKIRLQRFVHTIEAVKLHGSVPLFSDLPLILSCEPGEDDTNQWAEDHFNEAVYTKDQIAQRQYEEANQRRLRNIERYHRFMPKSEAELAENEARRQAEQKSAKSLKSETQEKSTLNGDNGQLPDVKEEVKTSPSTPSYGSSSNRSFS